MFSSLSSFKTSQMLKKPRVEGIFKRIRWAIQFFIYFYLFFIFLFIFFTLQYFIGFVIHQHEAIQFYGVSEMRAVPNVKKLELKMNIHGHKFS